MNLLQIITAILFFYVFGLGAILLTWHSIRIIREFSQDRQKQHKKPAQSLPENDEPVTLHVSGGLLEVNRLSDEQAPQGKD